MQELGKIWEAVFKASYQMLGEVQDAEDVVQELLMEYSQRINNNQTDTIKNLTGYYVRAAINHSINLLKSKRRMHYPGVWLPEPLLYPQDEQDSRIDISYGFVHLLTKLNPKERAVFILRESFDISYRDIAEDLKMSETHCRKLFQRSRKKIVSGKVITRLDAKKQESLTNEFIKAVTSGDLDALISMFVQDIKIFSDGGGKVPTAMRPINGDVACSRFLASVWKKAGVNLDPQVRFTPLGLAILFFKKGTKTLTTALIPELAGNKLQAIYIQRNPDKLKYF